VVTECVLAVGMAVAFKSNFFLAEGADWDTSLFTKVIVSAVN
jgi:hypothetical protein